MKDLNPGGLPVALPVKVKLGYGAAEFSATLTWTMVSVLFLFYLTDIVGMNPGTAGFIIMIGTLWDAVTDPSVGILSDRIKSKWGRRRPFLLAVALPFGVVTWLLFTDFGLSDGTTKLYFVLGIMAYYTASTLLDVPYTSLAAEMTQDYDERTSLNGYRAVFSQIAAIVAAALPWILVSFLSEKTGSEKSGWSLMAGIFGFCTVLPILITWRTTEGRELHPETVSVKLKDIITGPLHNRTFLFTTGVYALGSIGMSAVAAVMVYHMKYYMVMGETMQSVSFLLLFACSIFWIPVVDKVSRKYGKRESFILFLVIWAVVMAVSGPLLKPDMTTVFFAMMVIASGGVISISMTGWAMIPDAIEVDEFKTGQRREGLYVGIILFSRKASVALVLWLIGITLQKVGYVPDAVQTPSALMGIRILFSEGTAFFLAASVILAAFMPMTRKRHLALKEAIRAKKAGEEWDEESIRSIL